jgi:(p)ppGpp synthase/HD superfamily hydrolase
VSAVEYARGAHEGHVRKGTEVPYLAHVLAVSAIVLEHDGDEDQAIAALLHDTAEDAGGEERLAHIAATFGDRVAGLVRHCSDSLTADPTQKAPWWERKVAYLDRARQAPIEALVVSAADKVHNAEALEADYRRHGEELWSRFNRDAGRAGQLWYQEQVALVIGDRLSPHHPPLADRLDAAVRRLVASVVAVVGPEQVARDRDAARSLERDTRRRLSPEGG